MKMRRLVVVAVFSLTALLLGWLAAAGLQHFGGSGEFADFQGFLEARLKLPEKRGSSCPVEPGEQPPLYAYRLVQESRFDLDGDGTPETFTLRDGRLTVEAVPDLIWESPPDWWVEYYILGDATNDGSPELNLIVWKEGSFGPQKPFWLEEEEPGVKNHFFIFKLEKGKIKPVWQSSSLDRPNYRTALVDHNGDGQNELLALEGCYTDPSLQKVTLWTWNGWGFSRID